MFFFDKKKESTLCGRTILKLNSTKERSIHEKTMKEGERIQKKYTPLKVVGRGAFGVVCSARDPVGDLVAMKKVREDPTRKNREVEIMEMVRNSPNIVSIKRSFRTAGKIPSDVFLNIVMEYLPTNVHDFVLEYRKKKEPVPMLYIKLFSFQMFYGLYQLHKKRIVHRDIKPQNLLLNDVTGELKICDFGSAKKLDPKEKNISYIQSRYYRAPELIYGCQNYTTSIDIWSAGCVIAEMLLVGRPIFMGNSQTSQLLEIAKVIGNPTDEDLMSFTHNLIIRMPQITPLGLKKVLPEKTPKDLLLLLDEIFSYAPKLRPSAKECLENEFFDDLFEEREGGSCFKMPNGNPILKLKRKPE